MKFTGVLRSAKTVRTPIKFYVSGDKQPCDSTFVTLPGQKCEFCIQFANFQRRPLFYPIFVRKTIKVAFVKITGLIIPLFWRYLSNHANFDSAGSTPSISASRYTHSRYHISNVCKMRLQRGLDVITSRLAYRVGYQVSCEGVLSSISAYTLLF